MLVREKYQMSYTDGKTLKASKQKIDIVIGYGDNMSAGNCLWGPDLRTTIKKIYHARLIGAQFRRDFGIA